MGYLLSAARFTFSCFASFTDVRQGPQQDVARREVYLEPLLARSTSTICHASITSTREPCGSNKRSEGAERPLSRRDTWKLLNSCLLTSAVSSIATISALESPATALALEQTEALSSGSTSATAKVTNKIYFDVSFGLVNTAADQSSASARARRIVIGLFGDEAPDSVEKLIRLSSKTGLAMPCRPRATRQLQREQLQANSLYSRCKEFESVGVTLKDSTVWRIIPGERVDVGAVSGKFLAREYPAWGDSNALRHDALGVVSVRKGNQGGFGVTITLGDKPNAELDDLNVVVGRVVDGIEILEEINSVPVIKAAKQLNYKGLSGGESNKEAPSRSCTYGGPLYCNENKPLVKLTVSDCGVL